MTTQLPEAVLWDMDGTIIDTEPAWLAAERALVESFGGSWTHSDGELTVGFGLWECARLLQEKGVTLGEAEIIDTLTTGVIAQLHGELPWRPGALELMQQLQNAGVKQALVTMSFRRMAEHIADRIPFAPFELIIAGDDVTNSKPHPEAYLVAAERLGVAAIDCVAIEDSIPGAAAAMAAGTVTIAIPHQVELAEHDGYQLWTTLADRGIADIAAEYAYRLANPLAQVRGA